MKKHQWTALIIFIVLIASGYAAHLIHWDETPLEQSLFMLLLLPGLIAERPFMELALNFFPNPEGNFDAWRTLMNVLPLITGIFYAVIYYLIVIIYKKIKRSRNK